MVALRRIVQAGFFALVAIIVWQTRYPLEIIVNPALFFRADPLLMLLTSIAERIVLPGLALALAVLLVSAVLGRAFCGWACPLGATTDFWAFLAGRAARLARLRLNDRPWRAGRSVKYALLAVCAGLAVAGVQIVWLFDPVTIFVRSLSFSVVPLANGLYERVAATVIPATHYYPPLETAYRWVKDMVFDPRPLVFSHAAAVSSIFVAILALTVLTRRFWCRNLCPLGALLALAGRRPLLRRAASSCGGDCRLCQAVCRMGAINADGTYDPAECVLCMDCVEACPSGHARFGFTRLFAARRPAAPPDEGRGITRAQFFGWAGAIASMALSSCAPPRAGLRARAVIRPPAALPEEEFVRRCVRCGNCMKVCVTNGLQPVMLECGPDAIWTPNMDPSIGYCEYGCTLCGQVCPTGALPPLTVAQKARTKMGVATILRDRCIPWATGKECLVCEEHCPVPTKAIQTRSMTINGTSVLVPFVDADACVGCALCQNRCPVTPGRKGIEVSP